MKKRLFNKIKELIGLLILLFTYYFLHIYTGLSIPCPFRLLTGFKCPGCGITSMLFSMINFRFKEAFYYNPLVFIMLPFIIAYFIYINYLYIYGKKDKILKKIPNYVTIILIFITIVYGVVRNIINI